MIVLEADAFHRLGAPRTCRPCYPLWQALLHQVNHATQHRSEAALLLTAAGHSPGNLDFLVYFDELK